MTFSDIFDTAVEKLRMSFSSSKGDAMWTEEDARNELGQYLRQELSRQGARASPHFGIGVFGGSDWFKSNGFHLKHPNWSKALDAFEAEKVGKKKAYVDMVLYNDSAETDRLPIFPLVAEVKYAWLYSGHSSDINLFLKDRDKLRLLKRHKIAQHVCFVFLDEKLKRFHGGVLSQGWDPVKVYSVLVENPKNKIEQRTKKIPL